MTKGDELQYAFSSEQHNEHQIDARQNVSHIFTLIVCFHHHCDHVKTDENHDADVKNLSSYKVKDHSLKLVLQRNRSTLGRHFCVYSNLLN